jgi:hypothetical protein
MLKIKIDPTIYMKTKDRLTKCTAICSVFSQKTQSFRDNEGQSSDFLTENAKNGR